jgi:hypothetical protein
MVFDTPDHLYRLLDSRGNAVVRDLLASHNGLFRFRDRDQLDMSNTFKIEYLRAGREHRLAVKRQQAPGRTRARRFQLAMEDLFRHRGTRAIARRFSDGKANARAIAKDLKADFGEIWTRLWPPGSLEDAVAAQGLQFSVEGVAPWLADDTAGAPFSLRTMDAMRSGIVEGDTVVLVYRHDNARIEIRFKSDGSARGARSIDRMLRMAKGMDRCAGHAGEYSNLRTLMAQFVRVSVEEEAPALLYERARSRVPRAVPDKQALQTRTRDYVCLPIVMDPAGVADEAESVIALAVRASMADYRLHARDMANTMVIAPAADAALSLHTVDAYAWAGLNAIQATAEERLRGHPLPAFCATLEQQMGVSPQAWDDFANRARRAASGVKVGGLPQANAAPFLISALPAPAGTEVVRFEGKPSFWQALWGQLNKLLRRADASRPAREAVLVATWPAALRFPVGTNASHGRYGMARLGVAQAYLGLPRLYERLHRSLHDNAMHENVLPAVRTAVAKVIGDMRKEMRVAWMEQSQVGAFVSQVAGHFGIPHQNALSAVVAMRDYFSAEHDFEAAVGQRAEARRLRDTWDKLRRTDTRLERGAALATEAFATAQAAVMAAEQTGSDALKTLAWELRGCNVVQGKRMPVIAAFVTALGDPPAGLSELVELVPGMKDFRQGVLTREAQIDEHKRLLRQRLAAVRVGKATLGEFEAWTRAEMAYADHLEGTPESSRDQGVPPAVEQADAPEKGLGRRGPQSPREAVYWHLIGRLSGIVDTSPDRVEAADAVAAYGSGGRLRRLPAVATVVESSYIGRRSKGKAREIPPAMAPDTRRGSIAGGSRHSRGPADIQPAAV